MKQDLTLTDSEEDSDDLDFEFGLKMRGRQLLESTIKLKTEEMTLLI